MEMDKWDWEFNLDDVFIIACMSQHLDRSRLGMVIWPHGVITLTLNWRVLLNKIHVRAKLGG